MHMIFENIQKKEFEIQYMELDVEPRYWEDMTFNSQTCEEDDYNIWGRNKNAWSMIFDINNGKVENWTQGNTAQIHFKVADAGIYYLLDKNKKRLLIKEGYVPSGVCHGSSGYGDYIIMKINKDGFIENFNSHINSEQWEITGD